jgi:hypothetical protein
MNEMSCTVALEAEVEVEADCNGDQELRYTLDESLRNRLQWGEDFNRKSENKVVQDRGLLERLEVLWRWQGTEYRGAKIGRLNPTTHRDMTRLKRREGPEGRSVDAAPKETGRMPTFSTDVVSSWNRQA